MRRAALPVLCLLLALLWPAQAAPGGPGRIVLRFVDRTRVAHFANGSSGPRRLVTYVRIPSGGHRPYPLLVFAHGFDTVPRTYAHLLDAWARAGFVVAAPVFPVESSTAPGGADEQDLSNQPGDVSFVISRLLAAPALRGLVDPARIAVAGQSDGAETAFAVAYQRGYRDARVRAALVLSGSELPPGAPLEPSPATPPLLAVQGTSDRVNPPELTAQLFRDTPRPKFLLALLGAGHLPPYTSDARELAVVERTTIAFLDHVLRGAPLRPVLSAGNVRGVARLTAEP